MTNPTADTVRNFEDLRVWQYGMELVDRVYKLTATFPKDELYGLTSQIKRSAVSIPSNIAEGSVRGSKKEFLRFVSIARGSIAELRTQILIAKQQNFISPVDSSAILLYINDVSKMLAGLFKSLK